MAGHHHDNGAVHAADAPGGDGREHAGHEHAQAAYAHASLAFGRAFAVGIALNAAYVAAEAVYQAVDRGAPVSNPNVSAAVR